MKGGSEESIDPNCPAFRRGVVSVERLMETGIGKGEGGELEREEGWEKWSGGEVWRSHRSLMCCLIHTLHSNEWLVCECWLSGML